MLDTNQKFKKLRKLFRKISKKNKLNCHILTFKLNCLIILFDFEVYIFFMHKLLKVFHSIGF